MLEIIQTVDETILLWIQETLRTDWLTPVMKAVTFLGDSGWFWIVLAACVVFVCLDLLLTALMLRFGRKGMFFFLVPIWVITLIINPALNAVRSNPGSLMSKLGEGLIWLGGFLYGVSGIIAGAALVLVLMGGSVVYLLRAPVRL